MNRAERRRAKKAGIPVKKEPVVNIKAADVQKIKQDASKEAADKAFLLMLGLEQIWDRCKGLICSGENYCKCWRLGKVEQIEQMLYYLNLKSKKNI